MGLYDCISSDYPLPLPVDLGELTPELIQKSTFQTKDLENMMGYYKIDSSGQLLIECLESEWREGNKDSKSILDRLGYLETIKSWWEPANLTTTVVFYEFFQDDKNQSDYWIDYQAEFVSGKVNFIKVLKFEVINNAQRKENDAKWKAELKASYKLQQKWFIRYLYLPYKRLIRFIFRNYDRIKQKLPTSYQVERF